ncbi:GGDEF: diguanylate cyclase (GGDEF) domain [Solimicrobium silvestre]|uniref:GGDEF: diguanylate cyclase (GGDEF) domain n=2 Tax=Solimicrobium silvestre TaxID=2099400 RepID=A0A2S9H2A9_9BURK|nr:GGDEF: diguanylate cyclase (GGDEF) domain [Solimicrobium silvestre]
MVFNTGLCFALAGVALALPEIMQLPPSNLQTVMGAFLIGLCCITLLEITLDKNFGIDLVALHTWLNYDNVRPGRMAPNSALGFICAGLVLVLMNHVNSKWQAIAVQVLTYVVLVIGLTGLVGYYLNQDLLFGWARSARMSINTAIGMIVTAGALRFSWHHADWYRSQKYLREDQKITLASAAIIIVVIITAGLTSFVVLQQTLEATLNQSLRTKLSERKVLFRTIINAGINKAQVIAQNYLVTQRFIESSRNDQLKQELAEEARKILGSQFTGVTLFDPLGKQIFAGGQNRSADNIQIKLNTQTSATLFWDDGFFLKTEFPIEIQTRQIGKIVLEQKMDEFEHQMFNIDGLGASAEIAICTAVKTKIQCFPNTVKSTPFMVEPVGAAGHPLPMAYALQSETGFVQALDYRQKNVAAFFSPLSNNLGIVVKEDTAELYAGIRDALVSCSLIICILSGFGIVLLRFQLHPLTSRLFSSENKLRKSEKRLKAIADNIPAIIAHLDVEERYLFINAQTSKTFDAGDIDIIGHTIKEIRDPELYAHLQPYIRMVLSGQRVTFESSLNLNGKPTHLQSSYVPDIDADDNVVGFYAMTFDITIPKNNELRQRELEQQLRTITDNLPVLITYIDKELNFKFCNRTMFKWMGIEPQDIINHPVTDLFGITFFEQARAQMDRALRGERVEFSSELTVRNVTRLLQTTYIPEQISDGSIVGIYTLSSDVTDSKIIENKLTMLARVDSLTGLPNRLQLNEKLNEAINRKKRSKKAMAVMFIDIDHFKSINDTMGHAAGDAVLREFGRRLKAAVRTTDTVARMAGDEFVIIIEEIQTVEEAKLIAEKIIEQANQIWQIGAQQLSVTTSIGVAFNLDEDLNSDELLAIADKALYRTKANGRNGYFILPPVVC